MIYSVVRFHVGLKRKVLLVVPTTSLVEQMFKDFQDYGWDVRTTVIESMQVVKSEYQ